MDIINFSPKETIQMMREDSWLNDKSYPAILNLCNNMEDAKGIEYAICLLGKERSYFPDSAAIHSFLGKQYLRRGIEFNRELLSYLQDKVKGADDVDAWVQEVRSTEFSYDRNNISTFVKTYDNLLRSLELSQNNPTVFQNIIQPPALAHMFSMEKEGSMDVIFPMFPIYELFSGSYEKAVKRFEPRLD